MLKNDQIFNSRAVFIPQVFEVSMAIFQYYVWKG